MKAFTVRLTSSMSSGARTCNRVIILNHFILPTNIWGLFRAVVSNGPYHLSYRKLQSLSIEGNGGSESMVTQLVNQPRLETVTARRRPIQMW